MGLMQRAYETYEAMASKYAGIYDETQKEPLAPISHLTKKMDIEICIDLEGKFHSAEKIDKNGHAFIVPATESAFNRTSTVIAPYPLCDKLEFLYGKGSIKHQKFVEQLEAWANYDPDNMFLLSILKYIKSGSIIQDLCKAKLIKTDEKGEPDKKDKKIIWRVLGCTPDSCARNRALFDSFIRFYENTHYYIKENESPKKKNEDNDSTILPVSERKTDFCMISAKTKPIALAHRKSIVSDYGNAKIISSNDKDGFTFRGRFINAYEALSVSYEATQKAYNALNWLIANQGVKICKKVFLCWRPQGIELPSIINPFLSPTSPIVIQSDYKDQLRKTLKGWKTKITDNDQAVIAAFDGTSDKAGRLSVVYFNELQASDFLDRLYDWDESCCWIDEKGGIQSPRLEEIINFAFGEIKKEQKKNGSEHIIYECDDKIKQQQMQRLIICRIEKRKETIPLDIVRRLIEKCGNLQLCYRDRYCLDRILFTTCAVIRKYRMDYMKEEWNLALEPNRKDRNYQFGRLLAVMEKVERDTYESDEKREPNAIRYQSAFVKKPLDTTTKVMEKLKDAYYPQIKVGYRISYERLIGEIMNMISESGENWDAPLQDTYLMGYYLQKRELYTKNEEDKK